MSNHLPALFSLIEKIAESNKLEHGVETNSVKRLVAYRLLVEADLRDALEEYDQAQEQRLAEAEPEIKFEPDEGVNVKFTPEIKRKNGRKNCKECGTRLTGQKRLFCSKLCSKRNWTKNNRDKTRSYYKKHYYKQKAQLTLVK